MNNPKRKLRKLRKQFHLPYHQKNKVFKDNLTKKAKTHTPEDCKMLLKEILKDTNKWKTNLRLWTGRYKTVKMSILSKVTYRCNAIRIEIFNRFPPPSKQKYLFQNLYRIAKDLEEPKQSCKRRMKLKVSHFLIPKLTTNLQSSKQCCIVIKTDIETNGIKQYRNKLLYICSNDF